MPNIKKSTLNLENALHTLEETVEKMEAGDLSLEKTLELFEKGISLTKTCQKTLTEAEQKVKQLMQDKGQYNLTDYEEQE